MRLYYTIWWWSRWSSDADAEADEAERDEAKQQQIHRVLLPVLGPCLVANL
jgi:hypothetical protein